MRDCEGVLWMCVVMGAGARGCVSWARGGGLGTWAFVCCSERRRSDGKRRRRKTNKTRQRLAFYTFFQTTLPTSGARGKIEDDESIRSPSPLAPLEAEGRERDGHRDDDGINHTRMDRPLRGTGGRGGSPTLLPRGYTNGESGCSWKMGHPWSH